MDTVNCNGFTVRLTVMKPTEFPDKNEKAESLQEGFSQYWRVADDYEIHHGVLLPIGLPKRPYLPAAWPQLVPEVSKLSAGNPDGILAFARAWGLLGFSEQVLAEESVPMEERQKKLQEQLGDRKGDPLVWIDAHAQGIRTCLDILDYLKRGDSGGLGSYLGSLLPAADEQDYFFNIAVSINCGIRHSISRVRITESIPSDTDGLYRTALWLVEEIVNGNLSDAISPYLTREQGKPAIRNRATALLDIVYWHLARLAVSELGLEKCRECGAYFVQTDKRQKFCPPPDFMHRPGQKAESNCANRARSRKFRKKDS